MTKLLYQTDSYLQAFQATVTAVDEEMHAVALDQTAFYPGGGGQPYDLGSLSFSGSTYPIVRPRKQGDTVWHVLEESSPLPPLETAIEGQIDWQRRFKLMRTHTAMHVLCGTIYRDYGAHVTGGDMEPLKARMDFEFESLHRDLIEVIENSVNEEIKLAHPVKVSILPRQEAFAIPDLIRTKINLLPEGIEEVRVVEIEGLDLQADGGTHVNNTTEVGHFRISDYKSKGKINKRIYVELDE